MVVVHSLLAGGPIIGTPFKLLSWGWIKEVLEEGMGLVRSALSPPGSFWVICRSPLEAACFLLSVRSMMGASLVIV